MLRKERRDTVLLAFMAVITIAFLLYVFIPSGEEKKDDNTNNIPKENDNENKIEIPIKKTLPDDPTEVSILNDLNEKIAAELNTIYAGIITSVDPFKDYNTEGLKNFPGQFKSPLVDKLYKFSFSDLYDIASLEFPASYSNSLKFNIFLSLFLLKIQEEDIERKLAELPDSKFEKKIRFDCCRLLNNEIEEDYQLIPVLFYFKLLVKRLYLYPAEDNTLFFKERTKELRDLSPGKYLIKIRDFLGFSKETEKYRLEWIEYDAIGSNDKQAYPNLKLKTINFLKQEYLLFPDKKNKENNRWLNDLCKADGGDIELVLLNIQNQDPSKHLLYIDKIVYTPLTAQFTVLLKKYHPGGIDSFLDGIMTKRIADFHKDFIVIPFPASESDTNKESFKKQLDRFGLFLKRNRYLMLK